MLLTIAAFALGYLNFLSKNSVELSSKQICLSNSFYCATLVNLLYLNSPAFAENVERCFADGNFVYYSNCKAIGVLANNVATTETTNGRILEVDDIGHYS